MITTSEWLNQELGKHQDLNQTALAIHLKVSQGTVSSWLRGLYEPQPENCRKLARFFNVPEDEVLIIAGHFQPRVIGDDNYVAESRTPYHIGPRAHLDQLLDQLTDDQVELLTQFLEAVK